VCGTWGKYHEEIIRIRRGCSTYYMRCWLRLLAVQLIILSYPWLFSMLSPEGIDHNTSLIILLLYSSSSWTLLISLLHFLSLSSSSRCYILLQTPSITSSTLQPSIFFYLVFFLTSILQLYSLLLVSLLLLFSLLLALYILLLN